MTYRHDETAPDFSGIGLRLRMLRRESGLKLKDLAKLANCSVSLLSKFENDRASPSVRMLHKISSALGSNIGALFDVPPSVETQIARRGERPILLLGGGNEAGVSLERLLPQDDNRVLQGNIHIVPPGKGSDGAIRHEGEEFGYILSGQLLLTVDSETFKLQEGDSFTFPSTLEHSYINPGANTTRVIWINTPPTF